MTQKFTPARTEEVDGYVFASPAMRGILNKHDIPLSKSAQTCLHLVWPG